MKAKASFVLKDNKANNSTKLQYWRECLTKELLEEKKEKIHSVSDIGRSFRVNTNGAIRPDYFPFVFWLPEFLYDRGAWNIADRILPNLYHSTLDNIHALVYDDMSNIIDTLINYALWRGYFSWITSLAALYYQYGYPHNNLFQHAALYHAIQKHLKQAEIYNNECDESNIIFQMYYYSLLEYDTTQLYIDHAALKSVKQKCYFLQHIKSNDLRQIKKTINKMSSIGNDEMHVVDNYATMLFYGEVYQANRLILRYICNIGENSYLLDIVLQSYLQNQKYHQYLQRLILSSHWGGSRCWFEVEYCLACLQLENDRSNIWLRLRNKKEVALKQPSADDEKSFKHILQYAKGDHPEVLLEDISPLYAELVWNYYLTVPVSKHHALRRCYSLYRELVINPLRRGQEIDPQKISQCHATFLGTLLIYLDKLSFGPFIKLVESLAGAQLNLRALLGVYYFQRGEVTFSSQLLKKIANPNPLFQNIRADLAIRNNQIASAQRIVNRMHQNFPHDPIIDYNHSLVMNR